jgi:hypothetical protein
MQDRLPPTELVCEYYPQVRVLAGPTLERDGEFA